MATRWTSDASTVLADPHGKKQHVVETRTIIDKGTGASWWRTMCAPILQQKRLWRLAHKLSAPHGFPSSITLDRDTGWVGFPQGSDFPTTLVRFCHSLGVAVLVCDPHHPQQKDEVPY